MKHAEHPAYPFTDTGDADKALGRYKEIHTALVDMALHELDDSNDPSSEFRAYALQSISNVARTDDEGDKNKAIFTVLKYTLRLCEHALALRGLSSESHTVYESMANTYAAAFSYGWLPTRTEAGMDCIRCA